MYAILALALLAAPPAADAVAVPPATVPTAAAAPTIDALELRLALRDLWTNHVFWIRSYVVAERYDYAEGSAAADAQVVQNARTMADAIVPFYGQEAADALFGLLAGHYGAVKDYAAATSADDAQRQEAAGQALTANATAIADFLAGANPNLPKDVVLPVLLAHGGHHLQQIDAVHAGDAATEAQVWSAMLGHVYAIADTLAGALAAQFPDQVTG